MRKRNKTGRKMLCSSCNKPIEQNRAGKYGYCKGCHNAYMRANRTRHRDLNPEQRKKANARSYANVYIKRGEIIKKPCEKCGSSVAQMHHEDYNKPLEVKWFCRVCHLSYHKSNI